MNFVDLFELSADNLSGNVGGIFSVQSSNRAASELLFSVVFVCLFVFVCFFDSKITGEQLQPSFMKL